MSRKPVLAHTHTNTGRLTHTVAHTSCRALSQSSAPLSGENNSSTLIYTHIQAHSWRNFFPPSSVFKHTHTHTRLRHLSCLPLAFSYPTPPLWVSDWSCACVTVAGFGEGELARRPSLVPEETRRHCTEELFYSSPFPSLWIRSPHQLLWRNGK